MADEKGRFFRGLEALKIIVQIIAILVAGYWTYLKFIRTEAPLFETNARVDRSLSAPLEQVGGCLRTFSINFVNTGKSVLIIERVLTRGWKFYLQRDKDVFAELVDLDKIEAQGQLVFTKEFPDPAFGGEMRWYPFLGKFRAGEKYEHGFDLLFKKEDGAWIFLKTEIFIKGEKKPKVGGMWDRVCG